MEHYNWNLDFKLAILEVYTMNPESTHDDDRKYKSSISESGESMYSARKIFNMELQKYKSGKYTY
jgi:hypothetical protein